MLADTDEIHANRVGEDSLVDEIADDLSRMQRFSVRPLGDVAESVEAEFDRLAHAGVLPGSALAVD